MNLFGNNIALASKSMEYLWGKQQITLQNLANVDTPGYKSKYVTFEDEFNTRLKQASLTRDDEKIADAIEGSHLVVHDTGEESARLDENNVDADVESVELSRATLQYMYTAQAITSDIARLRLVIKGQ
ncbi:MAG: flagellar basal body rod protein FlgB [Lachnospiraceae bacterium]|jgi:flagellar basal-body rod protein FlgB|nr:flagellar basal body rod protein FlgB [Lachnospiraceae bacterium]MCI9388729.1 flagellar basal body rod protein FlgB [Lachnospiraceae bacterium]MCI9470186.1 flagellar basal body rod protein FlgB [Lachnospiraceae bacterium]